VNLVDRGRPVEVRDAFRRRIAAALAPHGFEWRGKGGAMVRRRGRITHRIVLSTSLGNLPGNVDCSVRLAYVDDDISQRERGWWAGGPLRGPQFAEDPPGNIADRVQAGELKSSLHSRLGVHKTNT
jgi:hypothetical protein